MCKSDFACWCATLGLWPDSGLSRTTHGGVCVLADSQAHPLHTALQASSWSFLGKGHGMVSPWAMSTLQMRKETQKD